MLHTLGGQGFDSLLTLISIKIEHSRGPTKRAPLFVSYMKHTGAMVIRITLYCFQLLFYSTLKSKLHPYISKLTAGLYTAIYM